MGVDETQSVRLLAQSSQDNRFRWMKQVEYYRITTYSTILEPRYLYDGHMHNAILGYTRYDSVNCYMHRRYTHFHRFQQAHISPVSESSTADIPVSYAALRATLPPDSPNFAFIPFQISVMPE